MIMMDCGMADEYFCVYVYLLRSKIIANIYWGLFLSLLLQPNRFFSYFLSVAFKCVEQGGG